MTYFCSLLSCHHRDSWRHETKVHTQLIPKFQILFHLSFSIFIKLIDMVLLAWRQL